MKISFHGAARTVTGSKHLITLDSGLKVLLDCGMFQGMGEHTDKLNAEFGFNPAEIDLMILSHAHIDHSGLIPKLVKEGFAGTIFCTPATYDLVEILLDDSAGIQESDTQRANEERAVTGQPLLQPLYTKSDVRNALRHFKTIHYNQPVQLHEQIEVTFIDAGHILGSSSVNLQLKEEGKETQYLTFSGDVGQFEELILRKPQPIPKADYIIIESTYGNSLHQDYEPPYEALLRIIKETCCQKGGNLIIPSFSVGRTQQLLYDLNRMFLDGDLHHVRVFLDSPLSIEATEVTIRHPECFNDEVLELMKRDDNVFDFPQLTYTKSVQDSKALNNLQGPAIIISASGMADAGRVRHHIANNIGDPNSTILMVGYSAPGTLGAVLLSKPKELTLYGKKLEVKANIECVRTMSAHGDYEDLTKFLATQDPAAIKKLCLVHGEYEVQQDFRDRLSKIGFEHIEIPDMHEEVEFN